MSERRDPFRGIVDSISEWNRMREYGMYGPEPGQEEQRRTHATAWIPTADIFARGDDLVLRYELAGVREEDIEITLTGGVLTISRERKSDLYEEDDVHFYTRERSYGHFRRSMNLPEGVDGSKIIATFDDGMLELIITGGAVYPEPEHIRIGGQDG